MKWFQRIFNFYLNASIHVALSVFSLVQLTAIQFDVPINSHLSYGLFFATISSYNFVKYGVEAPKYVKMANTYQKQIQVLGVLALLGALYHFYFLGLDIWIGLISLCLLSGLYALPLLPNAKNLRSLGGFKIFVVATVWTGTTVALPLQEAQLPMSWDYGIGLGQRFLLILILLLPFEIRDLKYDPLELQTLPQRYGIKKTKQIGILLSILLFFSTFLKDTVHSMEVYLNALLTLTLCILIWISKKDQNVYFASFWVESVPILWWGIYLLAVSYY
ncbi:hypothetical protein U1E44_07470 [Arenibacter sp. GZD96]|uniref:hypothetical protein n=1 Tax=Aurantibrevibacter litoralis TaxID=3106030 RepID=UPI002AFFF72C|nr:hypothetical protein [Arenibacter sp. GZD-96]MEA1785926.1 hypothetical protein [Arenibacter sp. GZD-96]